MPKHSSLHRKAERALSRETIPHANDSDPIHFSKVCHEGRLTTASAYKVRPSTEVVIQIDFSKNQTSVALNTLSSAMKGIKSKQNTETEMDTEISEIFNFAVNYYEDKKIYTNMHRILVLRDWYSQIDHHADLSVKEKTDEKKVIGSEIEACLLKVIKLVKRKLTNAISNPEYKNVVESVVKTELFKSYKSHHDSKKILKTREKSEKHHDHSPHSHAYNPDVLKTPKFHQSTVNLLRQPNFQNSGKSNSGKGRGRSGGGK